VTPSDEKITLDRFLKAQDSLVLQASDLSLASLSDMVSKGAIDLQPHYQRRARWKEDKQSALIESFLLNVPVPPIYLSEDDFGSYSVIDGKQRLTAVHSFMTNTLRLKELRDFPELNKCCFDDLPTQLHNALVIRPYFRVVTLLKQTDPDLKYEVFLRLNTGGDHLNPQEIRNVAFSGRFNDLLIKLSANLFLRERLRIDGTNSSAYMKMDDVEHVLRFFTTKHLWQEMGGSLASTMDMFMAANRGARGDTLIEFEYDFNRAIDGCQAIWGQHSFYKPNGQGWREQMISPLYDAQMVAVSRLTDPQLESAKTKSGEILNATRDLFAHNVEFVKSVTQATNNSFNVRCRIEELYFMMLQIIEA